MHKFHRVYGQACYLELLLWPSLFLRSDDKTIVVQLIGGGFKCKINLKLYRFYWSWTDYAIWLGARKHREVLRVTIVDFNITKNKSCIPLCRSSRCAVVAVAMEVVVGANVDIIVERGTSDKESGKVFNELFQMAFLVVAHHWNLTHK